jgi:adenylate kinase
LPKEELEEMLTCKILIHRDDDKEDVVKVRLKSFYDQTLPVIEHFKEIGKLVEIDGEGTPDEVFDLVLSALKVSK